ncbi:uncharacterized protein N7469_003718 [Penicillium citrinum]|uniref:Uncharacterized protein n=1 Tax=Penicillium citrinum TaxID=5077 RepID=A0A9W9TPX6_PENCI|nr:uncharacterized protein N7469_003718 [Penicillium citrinum]KAJ5234550.1 hypothetical protein N7469_003718 [Penicillium citrinum]
MEHKCSITQDLFYITSTRFHTSYSDIIYHGYNNNLTLISPAMTEVEPNEFSRLKYADWTSSIDIKDSIVQMETFGRKGWI